MFWIARAGGQKVTIRTPQRQRARRVPNGMKIFWSGNRPREGRFVRRRSRPGARRGGWPARSQRREKPRRPQPLGRAAFGDGDVHGVAAASAILLESRAE